MAAAAIVALVGITIVYQFQFIARHVPYSQLTAWVSSGPYWGIHTTPQRKAYLQQFASDLKADTSPSDRLLVYQQFPGAYLFWPYRVASNSIWISSANDEGPLPQETIDWMRAHHCVPSIVVRTVSPTVSRMPRTRACTAPSWVSSGAAAAAVCPSCGRRPADGRGPRRAR